MHRSSRDFLLPRNEEGRLWTPHREARRQTHGASHAWEPQAARHGPCAPHPEGLGTEAMMLSYAVRLEPDDNDTLLVTCPDLPGVVTYGADRDDALRHARDA